MNRVECQQMAAQLQTLIDKHNAKGEKVQAEILSHVRQGLTSTLDRELALAQKLIDATTLLGNLANWVPSGETIDNILRPHLPKLEELTDFIKRYRESNYQGLLITEIPACGCEQHKECEHVWVGSKATGDIWCHKCGKTLVFKEPL